MIEMSFEQLRWDAANSMQARKLSVPLMSIKIKGRGEKMTYNEFEKAQLKRQQLELFFIKIKGIGSKTANTIATCILSLPKNNRIELAKLIQEGVN